ncbi:MAG: alpha/beta hydrolase [Chloroflexi bacterium]|nr:alpha/beta hydrolase [Chloroflexota bacterium]
MESREPRPLAFRAAGSGQHAAVFVHGMCQSSVYWAPTLATLPEGVRGYAVDLPGFGDSSGLPGPYTIRAHADAVSAFVTARGLRDVVLVGNSMGGVVCQQAAVDRPDWLGRLVLVSTGPYAPDPAGALAAADREAEAPWDRAIAASYVEHFFVRPPANLEPYVDAAVPATRNARVESRRSSAVLDLRPLLGQIAVPTLIVQGERDAGRTPAVGAEMARLIPDADLHVIPGVGHTPMLEDPEAFLDIFHQFLAR